MEHAGKTASRALSNGLSEQLAADSEISELVAWVWQQLVAMYGAAVLTAYGVDDKPPKLWIGALSKLTPGEAKAGIAALSRQARSYPPNLTEVLEACRPTSPGPRYLGRPVDSRRLLERQKAPEHVRQKYLASMRALFGRSEPEREVLPRTDSRLSAGCTCRGQGDCDTCQAWAEQAS